MRRGSALTPRKSERTRQALLDAAEAFLWTHPFRDLSAAKLASLTGASRPTFYQYFSDIHDLMETLLEGIGADIFAAVRPWLESEGDPIPLLEESIDGLVRVCYERGPIVRAVSEASVTDERLESAWAGFLRQFDDAVSSRIEQHQAAGMVPRFAARPIAVGLNRLNASLLIAEFGREPRGDTDTVSAALKRIWGATLYGTGP
jgi:AcrR family transcriptional regulator